LGGVGDGDRFVVGEEKEDEGEEDADTEAEKEDVLSPLTFFSSSSFSNGADTIAGNSATEGE